VIGQRMLIADGALGSVRPGRPATPDDSAGPEGCNEVLNITRPDVVAEIHDGYRPAGVDCFGYPVCPDVEDRAKVMRRPPPERIGVTLSEEYQLAPERSIDPPIAHHPEAKYFGT
jgi:cobalamin-dependent methionine synthase I